MRKSLFIISAAAFMACIGSQAQALILDFSFENSTGNVPGTVMGYITGLNDNSTGPATDVVITGYPLDLGSDIPAAPFSTIATVTANNNMFSVANGILTAADYQSIFGDGVYLDLNVKGGVNELNASIAGTYTRNDFGFPGLTVTAVPEPMSIGLFGAGILGLILVRLRSVANAGRQAMQPSRV